jgi:hypothetical protein
MTGCFRDAVNEGTDVKITLIAGAVLAATLAFAASAEAADAIKAGKWEYTVTSQMPNMPQLPPGVKLPPNVQIQGGPGGMTATHVSCVTPSDPIAELRRPHGPSAAQSQCRIEKMERSGGMVSWASSCTSPDATVRSEGTAHYAGDRMEANFATRTTPTHGSPMAMSNHVVGHYLGPCDSR